MLRCLIHILVNADPMSLVPPEKHKNKKRKNVLFNKIIHEGKWTGYSDNNSGGLGCLHENVL